MSAPDSSPKRTKHDHAFDVAAAAVDDCPSPVFDEKSLEAADSVKAAKSSGAEQTAADETGRLHAEREAARKEVEAATEGIKASRYIQGHWSRRYAPLTVTRATC